MHPAEKISVRLCGCWELLAAELPSRARQLTVRGSPCGHARELVLNVTPAEHTWLWDVCDPGIGGWARTDEQQPKAVERRNEARQDRSPRACPESGREAALAVRIRARVELWTALSGLGGAPMRAGTHEKRTHVATNPGPQRMWIPFLVSFCERSVPPSVQKSSARGEAARNHVSLQG